jgi:hypothetical protein
VIRCDGVTLEFEAGDCYGVDTRFFERVQMFVSGPIGRASEGASCQYPGGEYCRGGLVCSPYQSGKCYPFCDLQPLSAGMNGCEAWEDCVEPDSGIDALDGGICY